MSHEVLRASDVGKAYVRYRSELHRFARWGGLPTRPVETHWVLRHIDIRLEQGEAVGVIGQNGAGKSTLLKMIAGTTAPTEGTIALRGRVSALLELGLGFSPELSGRENVRHTAGLMGLGAAEVEALMPSIEAFAEIGDYFDKPVRTYSSGMQMRVAFSVATAVRPDVLIVDEALAVGDAYFVHKSFRRIREFREQGTALLIVSHDPSAIQALCDRAILLERGRLLLDGPPREVADYYNALIAERENRDVAPVPVAATASGTGEARFAQIVLRDAQERPVEHVFVGQSVILEATVVVERPVERLVFGYMIRDRLGQAIYGTNTHFTDQAVQALDAGETVRYRVGFDVSLGAGTYSVSVALSSTETHLVNNYEWRDLAVVFSVSNAEFPRFVGLAHLPPDIVLERETGAAHEPA